MGEASLTRSLAAPRAAHPYPPDRVLNTAGNRVIGLNAGRAKFQMRTAVAVWQHARDRIRRRAGRVCAILESEIGMVSAGRRSIVHLCNPIRGRTGRLKHGVSNLHGASATR